MVVAVVAVAIAGHALASSVITKVDTMVAYYADSQPAMGPLRLLLPVLAGIGAAERGAAAASAPAGVAPLNLTCTDAIVGAGWSGVYFAYRRWRAAQDLAAADADTNADAFLPVICLFEATDRVGGRTYSVPGSKTGTEFVLDVGAYRFSPDMHLPGDLILHDLQLPTACYEPGCPPAYDDFPKPFLFNYSAPLRRVVDPVTQLPAGYVTAIHAMLDAMQKGSFRILVTMEATLTDVRPGGRSLGSTAAGSEAAASPVQLVFSNAAGGDTVVTADTVMLNLPRHNLLALPSVLGAAAVVPKRTQGMLQCAVFDQPADLFNGTTINGTGLCKVRGGSTSTLRVESGGGVSTKRGGKARRMPAGTVAQRPR
jgi:hypothetical protein